MTNHTINVGTEGVINPDDITVSVGDTVTFNNTGTLYVKVDLPNDLFGTAPHLYIDPASSDVETVSAQAAVGDNQFDVDWQAEPFPHTTGVTLGDGVGDGRKSGNIRVDD